MSAWTHAFHPRRSVAAAVGWCVGAPLSLLWWWQLEPEASGARLAWGWAVIAAVAVCAGTLAGQAWRQLQRTLDRRAPDDLAPLSAPHALEAQAVVHRLNAALDHQAQHQARQKRLVADAAHQLRTPLAALRTLLQSTPPTSLAQQLPDLLRTVDRATNVANEFLSQMKLEQTLEQRAALTRSGQPLPLLRIDDVAREAALEFSPLIADKRLAFELDALPLAVQADAWMLGELLRNLLANAIGQTPSGSPLGIVVREALGAPELVVWDSGGGIADAVRERAFEPFAAATRGTGVGLGLSICRQLAQAMGAQVALFNRSDGDSVVGVDAVVRWQRTDGCAFQTEVQGDTL